MDYTKIQYRPDAAKNQEPDTLDDETNVVQLHDDDASNLAVILEYVVRNEREPDGAIRKVLRQSTDWRARVAGKIRLQNLQQQVAADARQEDENEKASAIERLRAGYTKVPNEVLLNAEVSGTAKLIYWGLLVHQESRGYTVIEHATLGAYAQLSDKQIYRYLKELEAASWIEIQRRGTRKANGYKLTHLAPVFKKPKRKKA